MTAFETLDSIREQKRDIIRYENELAEFRESLKFVKGIDISHEHVQRGRPCDGGFAETIARIEETERLLLERIAVYYRHRADILQQLEKIHEPLYRDILYYRFFEGLNWEAVAGHCFVTERYLYKLRLKAIDAFDEILKES